MFWAELSHPYIVIVRWLQHAVELVCGRKVSMQTTIARVQFSRSPAVAQSFLRLTRNVMLHDHEIWSQWTNVAVRAAWGVGGVLVAVRSFRWEPTEG